MNTVICEVYDLKYIVSTAIEEGVSIITRSTRNILSTDMRMAVVFSASVQEIHRSYSYSSTNTVL